MKKAIVVGATSGIGKVLSKILVGEGYRVGVTGRRLELLEELRGENPNAYVISCFDVCEEENIARNLDKLVTQLGGLDLLIISSGIGKISEKLDFEIEKNTILTNVLGFTKTADWALDFFENQKYGHLAAISSIAGLRGIRHAPAYGASKAFQMNYLEGLRQRISNLKLPVYITDIRPGFVDTVMGQGDHVFWLVPVEKAGRQIYDAIRKKKKIAYVSKRWKLMAWLIKLLPKFIHEKI